MNRLPELTFTLTPPSDGCGRVELTGSLLNINAPDFLRIVTADLLADPRLRELRIDCAGLDLCDSMGLSILLMLRRRVDELGVELHVLNRPRSMDRVLSLTGTHEYLTGVATPASRQEGEPSG